MLCLLSSAEAYGRFCRQQDGGLDLRSDYIRVKTTCLYQNCMELWFTADFIGSVSKMYVLLMTVSISTVQLRAEVDGRFCRQIDVHTSIVERAYYNI